MTVRMHGQRSCTGGAALVMAGGGARGAFEAGVLHYVLDTLSQEVGRPLGFDIFSGTSIGALNASFLAANADDPARAVRDLVGYWRSLTIDQVLRFGSRELASLLQTVVGRLPQLPRGRWSRRIAAGDPSAAEETWSRPDHAPHAPVAGVFDTRPLYEQMRRRIPWARLQRNLRQGTVRGVAFCATEVCTGSSVIFYQTSDVCHYRAGRDPWKVARRVVVDVDHAMASAAMPFLFPAVQIEGICYTDGALRQNTPLNPALRMGADRVLVISLTQDPRVAAHVARIGCRRDPYPGALFLLGRMVNVLLSQSLDYELDRVELYNRLLAGGCEAFGGDFVERFNAIMGGARNATYRPVRTCHVRPSRDLHRLALESLHRAPEELTLPGLSGRGVSRLLRSSAFLETELFSFLMFTPTYVRALLELGYDDARAHREALLEFFAAPGPGLSGIRQ